MTQNHPNSSSKDENSVLGIETPRELTLTRIFGARRELVFQAWTEPEHLAHWWGPRRFSAPRVEVDLRVGGALRIDMQGPDGVIYPMTGIFEEITPPERLVFRDSALDANGEAMLETRTAVTFEDLGEMTRMTLQVTVLSVRPEAVGALAGMEQGWSESFYRLGEHVEAG